MISRATSGLQINPFVRNNSNTVVLPAPGPPVRIYRWFIVLFTTMVRPTVEFTGPRLSASGRHKSRRGSGAMDVRRCAASLVVFSSELLEALPFLTLALLPSQRLDNQKHCKMALQAMSPSTLVQQSRL